MAPRPVAPPSLEQDVADLLKRKQPPTLEFVIAKANVASARVNNLFQTASGQWQANLRRREPHTFFEFATGPTPVAALLGALAKYVKGTKDDTPPATTIGSTEAAAVPLFVTGKEIDDEDLFGEPDDLEDLLGMSDLVFHHGDNRNVLRAMIARGEFVQSVVTDPPYGLVSVTKRFGKDGAAPAKFGSDELFGRVGAGFMGQAWDGSGIERDPEFWRLIHDVLLPGGYVLAFSSPRTGHWQAVAMELAGFVMHPFLGWVYGSGFPKAHSASKQLDRTLGVEGGKIPTGDPVRRLRPGADQHKDESWEKLEDRTYQPGAYAPGSPEAQQWDGWSYGGQALKPALEPIYVGQKPFSEKNGALNILKHGVGAINIDGCRVETTDNLNGGAYATSGGRQSLVGDDRIGAAEGMFQAGKTTDRKFVAPTGRWPANLIHDGSDDVLLMFPQSAGQLADASTSTSTRKNQNCYGEMKRGSASRAGEASADRRYTDRGSTNFAAKPGERRNDSGSAARFFNCFPPDADPLFYQAKAGKTDRAGSKHPTVKPIALMRWLVRLVTPPGGVVLDPFAGSGTTGVAAEAEGFDCILIEAHEQYAADLRRRFSLPAVAVRDAEIDDLLGEPEDDLLG